MEFFWCLLVLKTIVMMVVAFPADLDVHHRTVRQLYNFNQGNFGSLYGGGSRNFPSYNPWNSNYNPWNNGGGAGNAAAGASAAAGAAAGAAGSAGAGGAGAAAGAAATAAATGSAAANASPWGALQQGLSNFGNNFGNYGNGGYGGGSPVAPVAGGAVVGQQGASQTDSYTNSQTHNAANSQNLNIAALGVPLVNIGLSNSNSESQTNSGSRTQAVNQYGGQAWQQG